MSANSQPFYAPLMYPLLNVFHMLKTVRSKTEPIKTAIVGSLDVWGYLTLVMSSIRASFLAYIAMYWFENYPGFGPAADIKLGWIVRLVARNLIFTWIVCGLWDYLLYFSPLKKKLLKFKINPKYPSMDQFIHDAQYTTLASLVAAALEGTLCLSWSRGILSYGNWEESLSLNVCMMMTTTICRSPHFYLIHRMIHPWRIAGIPDIGKFLYKHVHSLHHKSHNPTSWSGTSMHPLESFLYYSSCLIPAFLGLHPLVSLTFIVDSALSAWTSHDGFTWPGTGNPFHMMHHSTFDCNYGNEQIPLDKFFGTYAEKKEDVRRIWRE